MTRRQPQQLPATTQPIPDPGEETTRAAAYAIAEKAAYDATRVWGRGTAAAEVRAYGEGIARGRQLSSWTPGISTVNGYSFREACGRFAIRFVHERGAPPAARRGR
jgi:hypothetical protein